MISDSKNKKLRLIFMGTPEFSLPSLSSLIRNDAYEIVGVFTQPDKPVGRDQIITPPPVKRLALENNLNVFQPEKIKTEVETIKNLKPDLIVVVAYGKIIPQTILDIPTFACINVHASLLPKYRGAACLNAPILNGDKKTGVTIMVMEAGLDTGPILRQIELELKGQESLEIVHDKLSTLGAELLISTLKDFVKGKIFPQIQDESKASYIKTLSKEDGRIDWTKSAQEIERMVRAYNPWPGTFSLNDNKIIKIIRVENEILKGDNHKIGESFDNNGRLAIQCGQDSLVILELQAAGKKPMDSKSFLRGTKIDALFV
ncbi:MAG: methionyl-tRNA formyltransferase [Patescibacteria group bacterium]